MSSFSDIANSIRLDKLPRAGSLQGGQSRNSQETQANSQSLEGGIQTISQLIPGLDPLSESYAQGLLSSVLGVELPTTAEAELASLEFEKKLRSSRHDISKLKVQEAFAVGMNNAEQLGIDESILDDPKAFLAMSQKLTANKMLDFELSHGDLTLGLPSASITPEQKRTGELSRAAANMSSMTTINKNLEDEDSPVSKIFDKLRSNTEAKYRADIKAGLGSDIDEQDGSRGLYDLYGKFVSVAGRTVGKDVAATKFLNEFGSEIGSQLSGLDKDEQGRLIVGRGDAGIEDDATFFLSSVILRAAEDTGKTVSELMSIVGADATDLNLESYGAKLQALSNKAGADAGEQLRALGLENALRKSISEQMAESYKAAGN